MPFSKTATNPDGSPQVPANPSALEAGNGLFNVAPPSGDEPWNDIFAEQPGGEPVTTQVPGDNASGAPSTTVEPQASPPEAFLKGEHSVYNSADEAIKGINEKDRVINELRSRLESTTGHDPLRATTEPNSPQSYTENADGFIETLSRASNDGNADAYRDAHVQLMSEVLSPLAPVLSGLAKTQAVDSVSEKVQGFREFVGSDAYKNTLDASPELAEAIALAEGNIGLQAKLPGLYEMTFYQHRGRQAPELVRAAATPREAPQAPVLESSRPQAPPAPPSTSSNTGRLESIRAQIAQMEAAGIDKHKF